MQFFCITLWRHFLAITSLRESGRSLKSVHIYAFKGNVGGLSSSHNLQLQALVRHYLYGFFVYMTHTLVCF